VPCGFALAPFVSRFERVVALDGFHHFHAVVGKSNFGDQRRIGNRLVAGGDVAGFYRGQPRC
jgi:hypothetical protein